MKSFGDFLKERVDLKKVEDVADMLLDPIDVEFSQHFFDQLTRPEHKGKEITDKELSLFFYRLSKKKRNLESFLNKYQEFVVKDVDTKINIPFKKKVDRIIAKTVMRKPDFKSDDPTLLLKKQESMKHIISFTDFVYEKKNEQQSTDRGPIDNPDIEKALKKKAEETGCPIGIIRAVMRRGMAAWKTGHRPGAGQEQWGYARVNSFLTGGEGTWGKADADLAKEARKAGFNAK